MIVFAAPTDAPHSQRSCPAKGSGFLPHHKAAIRELLSLVRGRKHSFVILSTENSGRLEITSLFCFGFRFRFPKMMRLVGIDPSDDRSPNCGRRQGE
jgi:hypothetical protein